MRRSKVIAIEGVGEITIKEVSPYAMYKAFDHEKRIDEIKKLIGGCVDLPMDKILQLYPSELEVLTDGFLEVNSSFLAIAEKMGIKPTLGVIRDEIGRNLPRLLEASYAAVMGKKSGTMDGNVSQTV